MVNEFIVLAMRFQSVRGRLRHRSTDLSELPNVSATVQERTDSEALTRTPDGKFGKDNTAAKNRASKESIKKLLGKRLSTDPVVKQLTADAHKLFAATLRTMPCDAAPVRAFVAIYARNLAVAGFFQTKAADAGLDTPQGLKFLEVAQKCEHRAEHVLTSALGFATKLAATEPAKGNSIEAWITNGEPLPTEGE